MRIIRGVIAAALSLAAVSGACAQTGVTKPKSTLNTEVGQQLPDNTSNLITPFNVRQMFVDTIASSQQAPQVNAQVGTSYTFLASDYGNLVTFTNAGAIAVSLPQAIGSFFPWNVYVSNLGAGTITITPTGSTINGASSLQIKTGSTIQIISDGQNYQLFGLVSGSNIAPGSVTNADLANSTVGDSYKGTIGAAGAIVDNAWSNCNGNNSALQYTNGTGTGCNSHVANLTIADQTLSGGANVTSLSLTTGSVTIDCGKSPLQFITNGGAFTITAPASDGSCIVLTTNNGTAGTITFSGFSVGSSTGDSLDTTNTHKFSLFIWRVNGTSGYRVAAHQ